MTVKYCFICGAKLDEWMKNCPKCEKFFPTTHIRRRVRKNSVNKYNKVLNVEIKGLEGFLISQEEILFRFTQKSNFLNDDYSRLQGGFIFGLPAMIISLFFTFFLSFIFVVSDIFFVTFTSYLIGRGLKNYVKIKRKANISHRELWKYHDTFVLTNKRLILKSLNNLRIDTSRYPKEFLEKQGDIILTDVEHVHVKYNKENFFGRDVVGVEIHLNSIDTDSNSFFLYRIIAGPSYIQTVFDSKGEKIAIRREFLGDGAEKILFFCINKT